MKIALDTNVLAFAEGIDDEARRDACLRIIQRLPREAVVIPVQVLGELFNVLTRKVGKARVAARDALAAWWDAFSVVETSPEVMQRAVDLATDHQLGVWDAVILAAASQAGCRLLLSEDLQAGFTWGGVTVVNPFAEPLHPLVDALMSGDR